ncbi:hypothetical protein LLH00_06615 [bacterium]|nr:hypothetical protein [bacterium]
MLRACLSAVLFLSLVFCACSAGGGRVSPAPWSVAEGVLSLEGRPVLSGLPAGVAVADSGNTASGAFLHLTTGRSDNGYYCWTGMHIEGLERFTALYRKKAWWMNPAFGSSESELPTEVQFLLWRCADGRIGLLLPLIDKGYRMNAGGAGGALMLTADDNMPEGPAGVELRGAYVALGDDPYTLLDSAFAAAVHAVGKGRLRTEKTPPLWLESLGWCTWNSFYHEVTHQGVLDGLKSFKVGGVHLGWLVLDDGWQQVRVRGGDIKGTFLCGLGVDSVKFPQGLAATVSAARDTYGVPDFFVWQTLQGYWNGIDTAAAELKPFRTWNSVGKSNRPLNETMLESLPRPFSVVTPQDIRAFYAAYHGWMASQGVTGLKVDNQSHLEFMTYGLGPMTEVMEAYKRALEASVDSLFGVGNLINCMGQGTDELFMNATSSVVRNSDDFFPDQPETHGQHLTTNAFNDLMTGQLGVPDWDMFQSGHAWGAFHASARAVSGGPVYLSDRPGAQDFGILARISLPDGRVLRCPGPARPTADVLFRDPQREDVALKMFNHNRCGAWVLGAWNCRYDSLSAVTVHDSLGVSLIPGLSAEDEYAVWSFGSGKLSLRKVGEFWPLELGPRQFELCTVARVDNGVAPLGRTDMYNAAGIFASCGWKDQNTYAAGLLSGGKIAFYSQKKPVSASTEAGAAVAFEYDPDSGLLSLEAPGAEPVNLTIAF